ncbi:replication factor C subunit 2 [Pilobolus umbonatus]|nr:replication factor C subunit 2 [Pilobolus umbonatus]
MKQDFFDIKVTSRDNSKKEEKVSVTQPWVEKYRPRTISDISSQEQTVLVLKKALQSDNLPHLLFYGPAGTGKTSTILALANELYGPELKKDRVLELNASDDRGINVVREKVKNFSRISSTVKVGNYPCPPYKILILDEADSMTTDAQSALRRIMEVYSKTTRICLICNYVSRIIEPITSRCAKFRFKPLPVEDIRSQLQMIATNEHVNMGQGTMDALIDCSGGDLRKAITYLQTGYTVQKNDVITPEIVYEMAGTVPSPVMDALSTAWNSHSIDTIQQAVNDVFLDGYSGINIITQIHHRIMKDDQLDDLKKAEIAACLGETDLKLVQGADENLQIFNLLAQISRILSNK